MDALLNAMSGGEHGHGPSFHKLLKTFGSAEQQASGNQSETRDSFQDDVTRLRRRFDSMYKYVLNPNAIYVEKWDIFIALALLYTCFITPCAAVPTHPN